MKNDLFLYILIYIGSDDYYVYPANIVTSYSSSVKSANMS